MYLCNIHMLCLHGGGNSMRHSFSGRRYDAKQSMGRTKHNLSMKSRMFVSDPGLQVEQAYSALGNTKHVT
jgi:hypothetical protein